MAMDKINTSPLSRQNQVERFRSPDLGRGDAATRGPGAPAGEGLNIAAPRDEAVISPTAHKLIALRQTLDVGRETIAALPDAREDRIASARERLDSGFYQSVEVREQLADKVVGVLQAIDEL